jgi:periplasmic protein TonB
METSPTIHADLNEILFEGRNKSYGAYTIRKNDGRTIINSFCIAIIAVLTVVLFFFGRNNPEPEGQMLTVIPVDLQTPPEQEPLAPKPPVEKEQEVRAKTEPQDPAKTPQIDQSAVAIPDSTINDTTTTSRNDSIGKNVGAIAKAGCKDCPPVGCDTCDVAPPKPPVVTPPIIVRGPHEVDESADIPNLNDIKNCIQYPDILKGDGFEGDVFLRVTIGEDGSIEDIEVRKSTHPLFTSSVTKCMKNAKGKAGVKDGFKVKSWVVVPFKFRINR